MWAHETLQDAIGSSEQCKQPTSVVTCPWVELLTREEVSILYFVRENVGVFVIFRKNQTTDLIYVCEQVLAQTQRLLRLPFSSTDANSLLSPRPARDPCGSAAEYARDECSCADDCAHEACTPAAAGVGGALGALAGGAAGDW